MKRLILTVITVAAVVCSIPALKVAAAAPEPEPDRAVVEASFDAAFLAQFPGADDVFPHVSACAVQPSSLGASWVVACFAQYATVDLETVVVTGIAPNRDTSDAPPILDPLQWPWQFTVASCPA